MRCKISVFNLMYARTCGCSKMSNSHSQTPKATSKSSKYKSHVMFIDIEYEHNQYAHWPVRQQQNALWCGKWERIFIAEERHSTHSASKYIVKVFCLSFIARVCQSLNLTARTLAILLKHLENNYLIITSKRFHFPLHVLDNSPPRRRCHFNGVAQLSVQGNELNLLLSHLSCFYSINWPCVIIFECPSVKGEVR